MDSRNVTPPALFLSEQEFLTLAFNVYTYLEKYSIFKLPSADPQEFDEDHLPSVDEYLDFCDSATRLIDNLPDFSHLIDVQSHVPYAQVLSKYTLQKLLIFTISLDYYERFKAPMPQAAPAVAPYFFQNKHEHLKELAFQLDILSHDSQGRLYLSDFFTMQGDMYDDDYTWSFCLPLFCQIIGCDEIPGYDGLDVYNGLYKGELCYGFYLPFLIVEDGRLKRYQPEGYQPRC